MLTGLIKAMATLTTLLFLVVLVAGCDDEDSTSEKETGPTTAAAISGEVGKELYASGMPTGSDIEYIIDISINNISNALLLFDSIEAGFVPEKGEALTVVMQNVEKGRFEIAPGETDSFNFSSNGYTSSLLADAAGSPLKFVITLLLDELVIAGPFVATLPDLQDLPSYYAKFTRDVELFPLIFEEAQQETSP